MLPIFITLTKTRQQKRRIHESACAWSNNLAPSNICTLIQVQKQRMHYRFTVHVFGAKSSPSVANFGLKQVANDFEFKYGQSAANFIRHSFYVDDGLISVTTVEEAIELIKTTRALCREGSLTLHKFVSNFDEVLSKIGESDNSLTCNKDLPGCDLVEKALGINWNMSLDSFTFQAKLKHSVHSRRNILSTICSIYDPLGFISPYILPGRIILQNLCKSKLDWDDKIPMNILVDYEHWLSSLEHLSNVSVPRCYKPDAFGTVKRVELHSFSDASMVGYGQCSYLRLIDDHGVIHCSLVLGKSRVCPLKAVTIPRLELVAALMSLRISLRLIKELPYTNIERYYWTDSKVVLGYLANETRRFHGRRNYSPSCSPRGGQRKKATLQIKLHLVSSTCESERKKSFRIRGSSNNTFKNNYHLISLPQ